MQVKVITEEGRRGIEVTVRSAPDDPRLPRLLQSLRAAAGHVTGYAQDGSATRVVIPLERIACIETSGRRAWIVTTDGRRLESPMRLFELEEALQGSGFVKASRQVLVNLMNVDAIRPEPGSRLVLTLAGRQVTASRTYAGGIKRELGIER